MFRAISGGGVTGLHREAYQQKQAEQGIFDRCDRGEVLCVDDLGVGISAEGRLETGQARTGDEGVGMKSSGLNQRILFGVLLVLLSVFCYAVHYAVFRDAHHIFIYFVGDVAFVFIEVLLVTLIIHQAISDKEKRTIMQKLNMVIGAFFMRMGDESLKALSAFDTNSKRIARHLVIEQDWSAEHFVRVRKVMAKHDYKIDTAAGDLKKLNQLLNENEDFVLRLLENPNLLEHESFTELLWAVSHVSEELSHRENLDDLGAKDAEHLAGDIKRAYRLLMGEWLDYMEHLKYKYPYLFSLEVRTNPFDANASAEVE